MAERHRAEVLFDLNHLDEAAISVSGGHGLVIEVLLGDLADRLLELFLGHHGRKQVLVAARRVPYRD